MVAVNCLLKRLILRRVCLVYGRSDNGDNFAPSVHRASQCLGVDALGQTRHHYDACLGELPPQLARASAAHI